MLFKKSYKDLVTQSIDDLQTYTDITNVSIGGLARSLLEIINKQLSSYYDVLDLNQAMGFLSSAEGYFLDLIGELLNVSRDEAQVANVTAAEENQKFYVTRGYLGDYIPTLSIPSGTVVGTSDDTIQFTVTSGVSFSAGATEVYVPITSTSVGASNNVGKNALIKTNLGLANVYTTNTKAIVTGSDTESDDNFRYRISKTVLAAEKANETAIRLAALSVDGVADVIMIPYARGIGSYDVLVIPSEGLATASLLSAVQDAIDDTQAYGITGLAKTPTVVPLDLEISIIFVDKVTDIDQDKIRADVKTSVEQYIVNIPVGGIFIMNELIQQVMDVSPRIKDMTVRCLYCREQPHIIGNIEIYDDEMFYPNPDSSEAIKII